MKTHSRKKKDLRSKAKAAAGRHPAPAKAKKKTKTPAKGRSSSKSEKSAKIARVSPQSARKKKMKVKKVAAVETPVSAALPVPAAIDTAKRKREPGGDSDRGFYLRLGDEEHGPANKARVKAAADRLGIPMNKFAAAATLRYVDSGLNPVTDAVPAPAPALAETPAPSFPESVPA